MQIRVGILTAPHIEVEQREHTFLLKHVHIGIGFHWDRFEDQEFEGALDIVHNPDGTETAINTIDLEDYLTSVISSEMSTHSELELLKAHAVISRSWAMRAMGITSLDDDRQHRQPTAGHTLFDVCADDHCQRYEGLRRRNERAVNAVNATRGEVLTFGNEICDCRYHKCCGGKTEEFETCWEDKHIPYLESVDCPYCGKVAQRLLTDHRAHQGFLNDYDQETLNFHDWEVTYSPEELASIIREKSGIDFGDIIALNPLKRGKSGRICELEIVGSKRRVTIGKELKIRLWLSPKCLYSSWFDILRTGNGFRLQGHGWGHGAGLCQIGAAEMAQEGFSYRDILAHYYPNTELKFAYLKNI